MKRKFNSERKYHGFFQCFTLRTALGNFIIGIRCSPQFKGTEEKNKDSVVIFAQPNASDLGEYLQPFHMNIPMMAELLSTDVYAFDYSGYGLSTGRPSEKNIYADIQSVYDFVYQTRQDKKIVLLGYSLGTAAVIDLAARNPARVVGVILVAPFTSGIRLFSNQPDRTGSIRLDRFITIEKLPYVRTPVLVCHGCRDDSIPVEHGLEIYKKAPRAVPPLFVAEADHVSIFNGKYLHIFVRIREFIASETDRLISSSSASTEDLPAGVSESGEASL
ncbi:Phospholipase/carboxylesterase [Trichostrongylus colubriformis]|uniref:Phospholipase/carboxylesterase n=1 Tax=Trichostrongylus colubriformis TaxID=6319 RepID=A0AAN8F5E1_TRICO